jgi:hypothetical protein
MYSTIGGGDTNTISANYSVIPGGSNNVIEAGADYSFAAGSETKAKHPGSFLWSDWDKDKYE